MKRGLLFLWFALGLCSARAAAPEQRRAPSSLDHSQPHLFVFELCKERHLTCVLDLTSKAICSKLNPIPEGDTPSELDAFVGQCPQYKWRKENNIYIIDSAGKSDSALYVIVGPIYKKSSDAADVMTTILGMSALPLGFPGDEGGNIGLLGARPARLKKTHFSLKRMPFKSNLIEAAKQLQPSIWEVRRTGDALFYWAVDSDRVQSK